MSKKLFLLSILLLPITCYLLPVQAQNFVDDLKKDKAGQGKVTINQSADIDKLVKKNPVEQQEIKTTPKQEQKTTPKQEQKTTPKQEQKTTPKQEKKTSVMPETKSAQKTEPKADTKPAQKTEPKEAKTGTENTTTDTSMKIMRGTRKTTGYRVQVYAGAGPDKRTEQAECSKAQQKMKQLFPDLPVYSHFYSPHWKCRIGNFTSLYEAQKVLNQVKAAGYKKACIVKGPISVSR